MFEIFGSNFLWTNIDLYTTGKYTFLCGRCEITHGNLFKHTKKHNISNTYKLYNIICKICNIIILFYFTAEKKKQSYSIYIHFIFSK